MKLSKIIFLILILSIYSNSYASNDFFDQALVHFKKNNLNKAKFKFEQDLVLNPKNEKSYLYLSKIFNAQKKSDLEEQNLNTVILLNPKNEEAIYYLSKLKLDQSDYQESKKLITQLIGLCKKYCEKGKKLKTQIENSIKN